MAGPSDPTPSKSPKSRRPAPKVRVASYPEQLPMANRPLVSSPRLGPYCCFTGRYQRPIAQRLLFALFHVLACIVAVALCAYHLGDHLGMGQALGVGLLAALVYLVTLGMPRLHLAAIVGLLVLATWSAFSSWNEDRPIQLIAEASGVPAGEEATQDPDPERWLRALDDGLEQTDNFVLQATKVAAFPLLCTIFAALAALVLLLTVVSLVRSHRLPKRIWFARFHPVWRRAFAPGDSPHPLIGVAHVREDALLREKLLFLRLEPKTNALRFQAVTGSDAGSTELAGGGSPERIPLSGLTSDLALVCDRGRWHRIGQPSPALDVRLLLRREHEGSTSQLEDARWSQAAQLPVRDLFAADNTVYGKTYSEPQDTRLLGVLFDSRPNPDAGASGLPRFTLIASRAGRVFCEYPHPDLLGTPYSESDSGEIHLPWRGPEDEPIDLGIDPRADSIHTVGTSNGTYHLYFLAFGDQALGLRSALGLSRADESRRVG